MDPLSEVLSHARATTGDQIGSICSGLGDRIREAMDQRIAAIEPHLRQAMEGVRDRTRREITEKLNNAMRRLKQADSREVWMRTMLDTAALFCGQAALFAISGTALRLEGIHARDAEAGTDIPIASAPAFADVIDSMETVVAAGTAREISEAVTESLGGRSPSRVYLLPVVLHQRVVAVLYAEPAEGERIDVSALELLCSLAAASMDATETTVESKPEELVRIAPAVSPQPGRAGKSVPPEWSTPEQELHHRAQRFARTRMAELVLRRMPAIRHGRASKNLYITLKDEIDAGRQAFRRQFIEACPSMVDYYHLELVKTLAKDDAALLGAGYPGPLR
jgi:hypothetical protein